MSDKEVAVTLPEVITDTDRVAIEQAKVRKQLTLAEAKSALAQNDNADLSYKYLVLQLYMKYGLTEKDAIAEDGKILRGSVVPQGV